MFETVHTQDIDITARPLAFIGDESVALPPSRTGSTPLALSSISGPSNITIEHPLCRCGAEMALARRSPAKPNIEIHTFECPQCGSSTDTLFNVDPMQSPAANWANANLHKPD